MKIRLRDIVGWREARKASVGLLAALAWMNTGCSTPQVPYVDPNPPDTAWYAYQQCLDSHPGINTARANVCDHAGDQYVQGYYYNSNTNSSSSNGTADTRSIGYYPNYNSQGQCISFNACFGYVDTSSAFAQSYRAESRSGVPRLQGKSQSEIEAPTLDPRAAYREYLKTLDEETLRRLTAEWLSLAASPSR